MKTILKIFLAQGLFALSTAQAAVVCEGTTRGGTNLKLTMPIFELSHSAQVQVTNSDGSIELEQEFENINNVWDGHMTGLVTAPGLSVKYEDHFGCIRNVVITTNVRGGGIGGITSVDVKNCRGGSTRDEVCIR